MTKAQEFEAAGRLHTRAVEALRGRVPPSFVLVAPPSALVLTPSMEPAKSPVRTLLHTFREASATEREKGYFEELILTDEQASGKTAFSHRSFIARTNFWSEHT